MLGKRQGTWEEVIGGDRYFEGTVYPHTWKGELRPGLEPSHSFSHPVFALIFYGELTMGQSLF